MTRPQIIRADTIDLQSPENPSAKDHTRQPLHARLSGDGKPAPQQAIALKHAEPEIEFHPRSPRHSQDLSNKELQLLHEDSDSFDSTSATLTERHGITNGTNGEEMDMGDGDGEDGLDDDMMDKISSSPSIEDGGCYSALPWPTRGDSLLSFSAPEEDAVPQPPRHFNFSSSLFLSPPAIFPLFHPEKGLDLYPPKDHHLQGRYSECHGLDDGYGPEEDYHNYPSKESQASGLRQEFDGMQDSPHAECDNGNRYQRPLPLDDSNSASLHDRAPSNLRLSSPSSSSTSSCEAGSLNEDDDSEVSFDDDSRFIDSGWGGECLRDTEDIDFAFVYALHTFFATVEGQANATKGDTMVLLDDSNSYWWLVRVVKDGSIGYLPAEHIETPTERLARLNKHRNIDLSQTMLGDNLEKPKNPLKKAIRRRNAKQVQFTAPTYYEASDIDYSTEEDEEVDGEYNAHEDENQDSQSHDSNKDSKDDAADDQTNSKAENDGNSISESHLSVEPRDTDGDQNMPVNDDRNSDEPLERSDEGANSKSKKGTVRNTDSFFKDDSLETRKINLTPSLLRDDSSESTAKSIDTKEVKTRASLDSLEKGQLPAEKVKEEKKRKEKKGMLSGLFKRKDKKHRDDVEDPPLGDSQPFKDSSESLVPEGKQSAKLTPHQAQKNSLEETHASKGTPQQPQRQSSKLHKAQPTKQPPSVKSPPRSEQPPQKVTLKEKGAAEPQPDRALSSIVEGVSSAPTSQSKESPAPDGITSSEGKDSVQSRPDDSKMKEPSRFPDADPPPRPTKQDTPKEIVQERITPTSDSPQPHSGAEKLKTPQQRMPLEGSNSSPDTEQSLHSLVATKIEQPPEAKVEASNVEPSKVEASNVEPSKVEASKVETSKVEASNVEPSKVEASNVEPSKVEPSKVETSKVEASKMEASKVEASKERLSESPVQVDIPHHLHTQRTPPLITDDSSREEIHPSPRSPASTPELVEAPLLNDRKETPASADHSSGNPPIWSGASLRAYLEDGSDIRDLLILVHHKPDPKPADPDHPIVKNLFQEERRQLREISDELDNLLVNYRARKSKIPNQ